MHDQLFSGSSTNQNGRAGRNFWPKRRVCLALSQAIMVCLGILLAALPSNAFFDEEIPPQQMVMSSFRGKKSLDNIPQRITSVSDASGVIDDVMHKSSALQTAQFGLAPEQAEQVPSPIDIPNSTASPKIDMSLEPYHILPEVGQKVNQTMTKLTVPQRIKESPNQSSTDIVSYEDVIRWVNETSVSMFTYSGNHLVRDQKNIAKYFSPEAWNTIDQSLFKEADSPFHRLRQTHGSSRAMSLDWPKSIRIDVNKNGKIWWMKVPIVAVVTEKNSIKRVFYEVKLGVQSASRGQDITRFIADEVVINQVKIQEKVRKRGVSRAR